MISKLLCFIGIHSWECTTDVHSSKTVDYQHCVRSPNCRYKNWMLTNEEQISVH